MRKAGLEAASTASFVYDENGDWLTSSRHRLAQQHRRSRDIFNITGNRRIARRLHRAAGHRQGPTAQWITTVSRRFNHPDGSFAGVVIGDRQTPVIFPSFTANSISAPMALIALVSADGDRDGAQSRQRQLRRTRRVGRIAVQRHPLPSDRRGVYYFRSFLRWSASVSASTSGAAVIRSSCLATRAQDEVLAPWRHDAIVRRGVCL